MHAWFGMYALSFAQALFELSLNVMNGSIKGYILQLQRRTLGLRRHQLYIRLNVYALIDAISVGMRMAVWCFRWKFLESKV